MRTTKALEFFGPARGARSRLAGALGISPASVSQWGDFLPELRTLQVLNLMVEEKENGQDDDTPAT